METSTSYPLYKSILYTPMLNRKIDCKLDKYWKLTLNIYNLIKNSNYGVANDYQTLILYDLCNVLNNSFHDFIEHKTSIGMFVKKMESYINEYNTNIIFSNHIINKYTPKLYMFNNNYHLLLNNKEMNWNNRTRIYVQH